MDLKAIKQVVELMKRSELSEFEIEEEGFKLRLCRKNGDTQIVHAAPLAAAPAPAAALSWSSSSSRSSSGRKRHLGGEVADGRNFLYFLFA